ncbi:MAG: hypothetical protein OXC25_13970 [Thiotrichales bacterium]|nr:hypothetical protein [Thiotrichales bacterium]
MTSQATARAGLKQETIAIVAVGLTMLGTMLFTTNRLEARIERVEIRIDRVAAEIRSEARADREFFIDRIAAEIRSEARADRELFSREILRLTSEQSRLAGIVEGAGAE